MLRCPMSRKSEAPPPPDLSPLLVQETSGRQHHMLRSLFSGISGLRSHQTMMDVTGNNIANVNTAGYKSSNTVFQDTLSQMLAAPGAPQGANGGTNPAQVGLGVRIAGIFTNFGQGA